MLIQVVRELEKVVRVEMLILNYRDDTDFFVRVLHQITGKKGNVWIFGSLSDREQAFACIVNAVEKQTIKRHQQRQRRRNGSDSSLSSADVLGDGPGDKKNA